MLKDKEDLLTTLRTESKNFRNVKNKDVKIRKILRKENTIFFAEVFGNEVVLKFSRKGYALNEAKAMERLREEGYNVPKLIELIPLYRLTEPEWEYGNLERRTGLLIYELIHGIPLAKKGSEGLSEAMKVLKEFHNDPRHKMKNPFIPNFQEVEVNRGKMYVEWALRKGFLRDFEREKIEDFLERYKEVRVKDWTVIHGDYSPGNLIESSGKIFMLDLEGFSEGADRFKDLGVFLAEVDRRLSKGKRKFELEELVDSYSKDISDEEEFRKDFFKVRRFLVFLKYDKSWRKRARDRILSVVKSSEKI